MVVLVRALRHRSERAAPRALDPPGGRHHAHAGHALDGTDHVDPAEERPPARAGLVHEGEALEPEALAEWRRIAAELAAVDLEAEDPRPVPQAQEPDHARVPGHLGAAAARCEKLPQAPERRRVEAGDDDLALRHQHAFSFA